MRCLDCMRNGGLPRLERGLSASVVNSCVSLILNARGRREIRNMDVMKRCINWITMMKTVIQMAVMYSVLLKRMHEGKLTEEYKEQRKKELDG